MNCDFNECYKLAELIEKKLIEVRKINDITLINKYEELLMQIFNYIGKIIDIETKNDR